MALESVGLKAVIDNMGQFRASANEIDRAYDKMSVGSEKAAGRMSKLGDIAKTAIGFMVGQVAVAGVKALASGIVGLITSAAPLKDMEDSFKRLATSYDINSDEMIASMQAASKGTIADSDLIQSANKALIGSGKDLGKQFGEALPKLLEMARASAKATGQDVGFLFESLVLGIKRSSPMIIDNTGLQLKLGEAQEAYAKSLGITVEEMTAEQKQIALLNATMEAGAGMVAAMGDEQLTAAEMMAQMRAQVKNLKNEIGKAFLPILAKGLKLGTAGTKLVISKAVPALKKLGKGIANFLDIVEDVVRAFKDLSPGDFPWEDILPRWAADRMYQFSRAFDRGINLLREFGAGFRWAIEGGDRFYAILVGLAEVLDNILPERVMDRVWGFIDWVVAARDRLREIPNIIRNELASPAALAAINTLKDAWKRLRTEGIGALPDIIREARAELSIYLAPKLEETRRQLDEWADGVAEWISGMGARITKWLDEHAPGKELTYEQMGFLTPPAEDVTREMRPWWKSISDAITIGIDQAIDEVARKGREYQAKLSSALFGLLQVQEIWEEASALGPVYRSPILERFAEWIEEVAYWIGAVGIPTIVKAFEGLAEGITAAMFPPRTTEAKLGETMTPLEKTMHDGFVEIGKSGARGFKEGLARGIAEIDWSEVWRKVSPFIMPTMPGGIAQRLFELPGMEDVRAEAERKQKELGPTTHPLRAWWDKLFKPPPDIGKDFTSDIIESIGTTLDVSATKTPRKEAKQLGEDIAEDALEGTKKGLEIRSPSRVYERIGESMAEGMANGLRSSWSIWRVTDAMIYLVVRSQYGAMPAIQNVARSLANSLVVYTASAINTEANVIYIANAIIAIWKRAAALAASVYRVPLPPAPPYVPPIPGPPEPPYMQYGGIVPGPRGQPQWIVAHGGEVIIPTWRVNVPALAGGPQYISKQIIHNWSPQLNARYEEVQRPASLMEDLETLAVLYRMG